MLSVLVTNSLRINQAHLLQLANIRLGEVSVLLNASVGPSMAQQDYAAINDVFRVSRRKEGIVYFLLFDQRRRLIAADGWEGAAPRKSGDVRIAASENRLDARIPIVLAGQVYGELLFGVSTAFIQDARNRLLRESVLIAAAEVLISFIVIALMGTWLTRNLKQLEISANAIFRGEYGTRVSHTGDDEIGVVGRTLNQMSAQLAHEMEALRHSEQQQRETASRLQSVLDAASEVSIVATDTKGLITMFNRGAEKMLGYRAEECVGALTPLVFHDAAELARRSGELSAECGRPVRNIEIFTSKALLHGSETQNWAYLRKDGTRLHVSLVVTAVRDQHAEISGYLGIARDITLQIEAQLALSQLNEELETRVLQRTSELEQANRDLAGAMDNLQIAQAELIRTEKLSALGTIVAVVAHELNTPIGNCLTVASTLHDKTMEVGQAFDQGNLRRSGLTEYIRDTRTGAEILLRGLNRSSELVNNFKQVAVDQTTDQRRQFDLLTVVNDVVALLSPTLRKLPYRLIMQVPDAIRMDSYPGPLEQVITNLVNNAITHAFDGKDEGTMTLCAARVAADMVRIEFADDGIGIEADHLSKIFDPFYTTKLGRGGTGLGLNIVHNIVKKMLGGKLDVESIYGKGTLFTIYLPLRAPE